MVKKPKQKGNKFETEVMHKLRELEPAVARTSGSGSSYRDKGDLINFRNYLIEAKHHKTVTWGKIMRWWHKIKKEAKTMNKTPLLIYKQNYQPTMVVENIFDNKHIHIVPFDDWLDLQEIYRI